jgi:hypothetical protein
MRDASDHGIVRVTELWCDWNDCENALPPTLGVEPPPPEQADKSKADALETSAIDKCLLVIASPRH